MNPIEEKTAEGRQDDKPLYFFPSPYVSYSSLNTFRQCSYSFYVKYFLKIRFPDNEKMRMGTIFQNALNLKYAGQDPNGMLGNLPEEWRKVSRELVKKAHDFDKIRTIDQPYDVDFGLGIPVRFIPDLLTENETVENKFTSGYYNKNMVRKQKQSTLYFHGVRTLFDEIPVYYQIFNYKKGTMEFVQVEKTQRDVDDLISWMDETLQMIKRCYDSHSWITPEHTRFKCNLAEACPNPLKKA